MILYNQKPPLGKLPLWTPNPAGIPAPVGAWIMNEGSGGKLYDLSLNGNDGTNHGAVWRQNGLYFGGDTANSYIDVGNKVKNLINMTNEVTVVTKIRPLANAAGAADRIIHYNGMFSLSYGGDESGDTNKPFFWIYGDSGLCNILASTAFNLSDTYHVVASFKESNRNGRIYINGDKEADVTLGWDMPDAAANLYIGVDEDLSTKWFNGDIYYVYIFNSILSDFQIAYLHQHPYYAWEYPALWEYYAASTGWTGKLNGVTNPAKINGVAVANIAKVMGIS